MPKYEVEIALTTLETMLVYVHAPTRGLARDLVEKQLEAMEPDRVHIARHFQEDWDGPEVALEVNAVRRAQSERERQFFRTLTGMHTQLVEAHKACGAGLDEAHRQQVALLMRTLATMLDEWQELGVEKED